jgi:hypothetical protein
MTKASAPASVKAGPCGLRHQLARQVVQAVVRRPPVLVLSVPTHTDGMARGAAQHLGDDARHLLVVRLVEYLTVHPGATSDEVGVPVRGTHAAWE